MTAKIGFSFVPFPMEIWTEGIRLTQAEFQLLGYLIYTSIRLGRSDDIRLTDAEIMDGRKKKDGTYWDKGSGISNRITFRRARASLIERGWLKMREDLTDLGRPRRSSHLLLVRDPDAEWYENQAEEEKRGGVPKRLRGVYQRYTQGVPKGVPGCTKGTPDQTLESLSKDSPSLEKEECAARSTSDAALNETQEVEFLRIPLLGEQEHIVTEADIAEYSDAYPAVDARQQLREIRQWNIDNPKNRKTPNGVRRHIGLWLTDKQNRGSRMGGKRGPETIDQTCQEMEEQWQRLKDFKKKPSPL